ncbi:antitoxin protein [Curtobacterium sp. Leaf261]|nr:antitoxin protein [Curtobacterium sp. Leaf261]
MANFDEIKNDVTAKAKAFLDDNKVKDALQSEKAEEISDKILDGLADAAKKVTGGKYDEQIDSARDNVDGKIGDE